MLERVETLLKEAANGTIPVAIVDDRNRIVRLNNEVDVRVMLVYSSHNYSVSVFWAMDVETKEEYTNSESGKYDGNDPDMASCLTVTQSRNLYNRLYLMGLS